MKHIFSGTINFYFVGRPEHNDIYSCLDTIPEFTLPRRKSVALVSDLVSIILATMNNYSWIKLTEYFFFGWVYMGIFPSQSM